MRKKILIVIGIICLILILVQCTRQKDNSKEENNDIIEDIVTDEDDFNELGGDSVKNPLMKTPVITSPIFLRTYEDIYIYYSMLAESKDKLRKDITEFFLSVDLKQIDQKGYAKYFGYLGKQLIDECQRFKLIVYVKPDQIGTIHRKRYHEFYVHNEMYYELGKDLMNIENDFNNNQYNLALKDIQEVYKKLRVIRETENEGESI